VKFFATMSRRWQREPALSSTPANVWPSALPQLREWAAQVIANVPVQPLLRDRLDLHEAVLFSDASNNGWGSIWIIDGSVFVSKGKFTAKGGLHINIKETLAVKRTV